MNIRLGVRAEVAPPAAVLAQQQPSSMFSGLGTTPTAMNDTLAGWLDPASAGGVRTSSSGHSGS